MRPMTCNFANLFLILIQCRTTTTFCSSDYATFLLVQPFHLVTRKKYFHYYYCIWLLFSAMIENLINDYTTYIMSVSRSCMYTRYPFRRVTCYTVTHKIHNWGIEVKLSGWTRPGLDLKQKILANLYPDNEINLTCLTMIEKITK